MSLATPKASKKSRIVVLRLSPGVLARFPSDGERKPSISIRLDPSPSLPPPDSSDKTSDSHATPVPPAGNDDADGATLAPPKGDGKKKKGGATATGKKRAPPSIDPNAPPREKGRPGPKKKPRLADGTIDRSNDPNGTVTTTTDAAPVTAATTTSKKGPSATTTAAAAATGGGGGGPHKLGPKANTGAINAGLRALDRSGKPCRKWHRRGVQLKSFTGAFWTMESWNAPPRLDVVDDDEEGEGRSSVKSESTGGSSSGPNHNNNDTQKRPNDSSVVPSERSHRGDGAGVDGGGDTVMADAVGESSPAPAPVVAAAAAVAVV